MNDRTALSPWRRPAYANFLAWTEGSLNVTYANLCADLDGAALHAAKSSSVNVAEEASPYENLLAYLTAWEQSQALCLLPKSWPSALKDSARERIARFANELPAECFYILPTSGSTGVPKLVVITKANWRSFWDSIKIHYPWAANVKVALCFEAAFDPFLAMVFLTLSQGGTLCPLPAEKRFDIFSFLASDGINVWASVPSLATLNYARRPALSLPDLQLSIFTGESLSLDVVRLWREVAPKTCVDNLYGPVETTVWVTRHSLPAEAPLPEKMPIGHALSGDVQTKLEEGELIIEGPQVALGYLTESGLERFNGVYATGDLATGEPATSDLLLVGRKDNQVKVLGQRIELEAVEAKFFQLTGQPALCCVDRGSHLCLVTEQPVDLENVRQGLRAALPPSHIPRFFYQCQSWPRTSSGKLDRNEILRQVNAQILNTLDDARGAARKMP